RELHSALPLRPFAALAQPTSILSLRSRENMAHTACHATTHTSFVAPGAQAPRVASALIRKMVPFRRGQTARFRKPSQVVGGAESCADEDRRDPPLSCLYPAHAPQQDEQYQRRCEHE